MSEPSSFPARTLQVLVVDDSAVVRQAMKTVLSREPDFRVEVAADPLIAMAKMSRARPDVIVLDVEMPRMDGLTFLERIMAEDPLPVILCSGVAARGTEAALTALELGAVDLVERPRLGVEGFLLDSAALLVASVRGAAEARPRPRPRSGERRSVRPALLAVRPLPAPSTAGSTLVAIGASTGGTEALHVILAELPREVPPIVVVQHMPAGFTAAFARRLDEICRVRVREASHGERLVPGCALIAPGGRHLTIEWQGGGYRALVKDGPLVSWHRPSVDVLFQSVAAAAGPNAIGVLMTGMGDDGAAGLLALRRGGAVTLAQDAASCVVYGMPKAAVQCGAVDEVVALDRIGATILEHVAARPWKR